MIDIGEWSIWLRWSVREVLLSSKVYHFLVPSLGKNNWVNLLRFKVIKKSLRRKAHIKLGEIFTYAEYG